MFKTFRILCPTLLILTACSGDIDDGGNGNCTPGQKTVTLTLATANMDKPQFSRAENDEDPYSVPGEQAYNAYVVMARKVNNNTERVEKIIHVPFTPGTDNGGYYKKNVTSISTEEGTFVFYNFANLPFETETKDGEFTRLRVNNDDNLIFTKLEKNLLAPAELEKIRYKTRFNGYTLPESDPTETNSLDAYPIGIPMSNREEFEINSNTSITLHLYRMLSKVRFSFINKGSHDVWIHEIKMDSITANANKGLNTKDTGISLLPPKDPNTGLVITDVASANNYATTSIITYSNPLNVAEIGGSNKPTTGTKVAAPKKVVIDGKEEIKIDTLTLPDYYINESQSIKHPNQSFPLTIVLSRLDSGKLVEHTRHALVRVDAIPRNSVLLIPVNLTEYELELQASYYPPIGGYPPYTIEKDKISEDFTATFQAMGVGGDFVLTPTFYRLDQKDNPESYIDLTDKRTVKDYRITVQDNPNNIFSTAPYIDANTGEILATLNGNSGTACIELEIILNNTEPGVVDLNHYRRNIYIHVP